jgi:hypothetical protein
MDDSGQAGGGEEENVGEHCDVGWFVL